MLSPEMYNQLRSEIQNGTIATIKDLLSHFPAETWMKMLHVRPRTMNKIINNPESMIYRDVIKFAVALDVPVDKILNLVISDKKRNN
jgi:plasmid maintenance system antidote protein VapI